MKDVRRVIAHLFTVGGVIVVCGTFHFPPLQADDGKLPHWAQDGYGASADGQSPYLGPQNGKLKWMFGLDRWACSPVVGADSTVYVGTNNGTFYAIDKEGREKWKRQWPIKNANVTDEGGIIKQHPAGSTFEIERDWITIGVDGGRSVLVQVGRVESVQDHAQRVVLVCHE